VSSDSNGNVISSTEYSYDKRDRIKSIKQTSNTSAGDKNCNNKKEFTYNDLNWLLQEDVKDLSTPPILLTSTVYTYDCLGNITSRQITDGSVQVSNMTYTYNTLNQLTAMLDTLSNVTTTYTYDLNGNMLAMDDGSGTVKKFTYNELNQLTEYNDGKGTDVCYAYNASGLRSQKSQAGNTGSYVNYYYSPNGSLLNEEDNTNVMSSYLIAGSRASRTVGGTTQWYISNGKDMVATVSPNSDGTLTSSNVYNYDAYGKDSDLNNPSANTQTQASNVFDITQNPFKYSGYYLDAESGLYYLQARYYSPELMRFISRDTYDLANRYAYCDANPISMTDPSGHSAIRLGIGITAALLSVGIAIGGQYMKNPKAKMELHGTALVLGIVAMVCLSGEIGDHILRTREERRAIFGDNAREASARYLEEYNAREYSKIIERTPEVCTRDGQKGVDALLNTLPARYKRSILATSKDPLRLAPSGQWSIEYRFTDLQSAGRYQAIKEHMIKYGTAPERNIGRHIKDEDLWEVEKNDSVIPLLEKNLKNFVSNTTKGDKGLFGWAIPYNRKLISIARSSKTAREFFEAVGSIKEP